MGPLTDYHQQWLKGSFAVLHWTFFRAWQCNGGTAVTIKKFRDDDEKQKLTAIADSRLYTFHPFF